MPYVASAQLLDRIVARVNTAAIAWTDVKAAIGLGIVDVPPTTPQSEIESVALRQLIDRQLVLLEIARFPPPDPPVAAVQAEFERMRRRAGGNLPALLRETGLDDAGLEALARATLRIRGYIDQRFGAAVQVDEAEARRYYEAHPREFMREGKQAPFEEVEVIARQRASAERLGATITNWLRDLRARAEVVELPRP